MAPPKKPPAANGGGSRPITEALPAELEGFPERAKAERLKRKWTQDELAEKAGVSQATISNLEKKKSLKGVRLVSAYRVAKIFGMTLDEFVLGLANPWHAIADAVRRGVNPHEVEPTEPGSGPVPAPEIVDAPTPKQTTPPKSQ